MRRSALLTAVPALLLGVCAAIPARSDLPGTAVIARVDGKPIQREALTRQLLTYYGKTGLEQLIDWHLLSQEAARLKVAVEESELRSRLDEAARSVPGGLQKFLDGQGMTQEAWREGVRMSMLAQKVTDARWPVKDSDLVRIQVRFALLPTQERARSAIQQIRQGQSLELIAARDSLEKGADGRGLVAPEPFLRVENPPFFAAAMKANLRVGQVSREPIESDEYWLVLKLEQHLGPETLTGKARETAVNKVRAYRAARLLPTLRSRTVIERPVSIARLIGEPGVAPDTVVVRVGEGRITWKALSIHLLEMRGKLALSQLVERGVTEALARKAGVAVSDAEVRARVAEAQKGELAEPFRRALEIEGITEAAWGERVRYTMLSEKIVNARAPVPPEELIRLTVQYIRVADRMEAQSIINSARGGTPFDQLRARSLDRGDGYIRPKGFVRSEQPKLFDLILEARLRNGEVLPQPVEAGGSGWVVLRLEQRQGPETLTGKDRESVLRRINARRMVPLLDQWRQEVGVEYTIPLAEILSEAKS